MAKVIGNESNHESVVSPNTFDQAGGAMRLSETTALRYVKRRVVTGGDRCVN